MDEYTLGKEFEILSVDKYEKLNRTNVYLKCKHGTDYNQMIAGLKDKFTDKTKKSKINVGQHKIIANEVCDILATNITDDAVYLLISFAENNVVAYVV